MPLFHSITNLGMFNTLLALGIGCLSSPSPRDVHTHSHASQCTVNNPTMTEATFILASTKTSHHCGLPSLRQAHGVDSYSIQVSNR